MAVQLPSKNSLYNLMINGSNTEVDMSNKDKYMNYVLPQDPEMIYQSGSDAVIEINNIVVDECYDLQFSYREMKEPVYGYRSQRFSHVLSGTVLIQGQFTLNYVHDKYLTAILKYGDKLSMQTANEDLSSSFNALKEGLSSIDYATALANLNVLRQDMEDSDKKLRDSYVFYKVLEEKIAELDKEEQQAILNINQQQKANVGDLSSYNDGMVGFSDDRKIKASIRQQMFDAIMSQYTKNSDLITRGNGEESFFSITSILMKANIDLENEDVKSVLPTDPITVTGPNNSISYYQTNEQLKNQALSVLSPKSTEWPYPNKDAEKYATASQNVDNLNKMEEIVRDEFSSKRDSLLNQKAVMEKEISEAKAVIQKYKDNQEQVSKIYDYMKNSDNLRLDSIYRNMSGKSVNEKSSTNNTRIDIAALLRYNESNLIAGLNLAEDYTQGFDISVSYHGKKHFMLFGVHITGHTDVLGLGGEPVKRYYTFIAQGKV